MVVVKVRQLGVQYTRIPALVVSLKRIQATRAALRIRALSPERKAQLWDELTPQAAYHTNHLEGNPLTCEEARAVIEAHRKARG